MEKMKKMSIKSLDWHPVEADPICSIESDFLRMKLKNGCECDGRPRVSLDVPHYTLKVVFYYCKKRAKIKLQQHSDEDDGDDDDVDVDDDDDDDDENLTAQQKKKLKKFDSKFLGYLHQYSDTSVFLDICYAALKLGVKSLYDLVLGVKSLYDLVLKDVVGICDQLTPKQLHKTIKVGRNYPHGEIRSYIWAFSINDTRQKNVDLDTNIRGVQGETGCIAFCNRGCRNDSEIITCAPRRREDRM